jgi:transcriptional regulator with XRE-family HTH domain
MIVKYTQDIVTKLSEIRKKRGITQDELGEIMETQKSNISRLEKCIHSPTLRMLEKYAHAIGVELVMSVK